MDTSNHLEYAKKMVIVPPELIARLEHNNNSTQQVSSSSSSLDAEMSRILSDKRLADNDKWKLYQQVLQRHLNINASKRESINLPIVDTDMGLIQNNMQRTAAALVDEIVESFPKIYKSEARSLLRTMARNGDRISWDSSGFVYVQNKMIPNSNIVDILHSIVRARKSNPLPTGWHEVMQALKEMHIPSTYINNVDALRFLGHEVAEPSIISPGRGMYQSPIRTPILNRLRPRADKSPSRIPTSNLENWEPFTPPHISRKQ